MLRRACFYPPVLTRCVSRNINSETDKGNGVCLSFKRRSTVPINCTGKCNGRLFEVHKQQSLNK
jgi:hypothetical protein